MIRRPPSSTLFPYTPLSRSLAACTGALLLMRCGGSARSDSPDAARPPAPLVAIESTTVNLPLSSPAQLYVEHDALVRSEEHTSELQSRLHLVCRLLL